MRVSQQPTVQWRLWLKKRFEASLVHTHTFDMNDLPEAIRYARDRVDDAIKVVVTNSY